MKNIKELVNILNKHRIKIGMIFALFLFTLLPIFKTGNNKRTNLLTMVSNKITGTGTYTEVVKSIEIESPDYKDKTPGSFHIDKSAKWTGINKAQVTFDVKSIMKVSEGNYKDIILVLDISESMKGDKIAKVKSDSIELVESLLSDSNNKVALVVYDTDSEIISEFTNDKDTIVNKINSLSDKGCTNYNAPLKHVDEIMTNYTKEDNRDVITLFLTDGYPNEDTPNQIGTYEILKSKYPYMAINGIQYEMGSDIKEELKQVSDNQWIADMDTLNNVLFEASISPLIYETFEVVDYIDKDYFVLNSVDDITVSTGTVKLTKENGLQKITWILDNNISGFNATMNIDLQLKQQYVKSQGYYPTNDREQVTYKLDSDTKIIQSDTTPVLKSDYKVIYDTNTPTGCNIDNTSETHFVYENVTLNSDQLSCDGYLFKGWKVVTEVNRINDDTFVMPSSDVIVRATWSKQTLAKSMDGTIKVNSQRLYLAVQKDAEEGVYADTYTGNVTDEYDKTEEADIYYYKGETPNNNVIFGGFCWQMVRTTSTGGVKMIYNGVPSDGKCNNTGANSQLSEISDYSVSHNSLAYIGYMYNKVYKTSESSDLSYRDSTNFGGDISYENNKYTLSNTILDLYPTSTHHYKCPDSFCGVVYFYYYRSKNDSGHNYYIQLSGGKDVDDAVKEMLFDDNVNVSDSQIKTKLDTWYENNMTDYTDYIEDNVFCNDRTLSNYEQSGWNKQGSVYNPLYFGASQRTTSDLSCHNITDRFSMQNQKAQLKYPVGLLTLDEALLGRTSDKSSSDSYYLRSGAMYWLMTPYSYSSEYTNGSIMGSNGKLSKYVTAAYYGYTGTRNGVRPVISLRTDVVYSEGDGTKDSPYIIEKN